MVIWKVEIRVIDNGTKEPLSISDIERAVKLDAPADCEMDIICIVECGNDKMGGHY